MVNKYFDPMAIMLAIIMNVPLAGNLTGINRTRIKAVMRTESGLEMA